MISLKRLVSSVCASLADQRDEVALRVHQQVEREALLAVAGGDAPDRVLGVLVVAQHAQGRSLAADLLDLRVERLVAFQVDELVDQQFGHQRTADAVVGEARLLPALHALAVLVPEAGGQLAHAGVEDVGVLQHLVVVVVLDGQAQCARLHAHVDVLGNQHHLARLVQLLEAAHHAEDLVVGLACRQVGRQRGSHRLRLEVKAAARIRVAERGQRNALLDRTLARLDQRIEHAADLPRVARHLAHALLVAVEFLQRHHRQEDVVLLEAEQRGGVVHQHVGVEHEQLGRAAAARFAPALPGLHQGQACGW